MGFLEKMVLDAEQLAAINELIPGAAVNTQESFKFRKINYWNQIFYSTSCSKVTKRNSYTVVFVGRDGNLKVGMILYYLKLVLRNAHASISPCCYTRASSLPRSGDHGRN